MSLKPAACAGVLSLGVATGCEALAPAIVPVQTSRIVQTEGFQQLFRVSSVPRAERVFRQLLGSNNYEALSAAEWVPFMDILLAGNLRATGSATFVISLLPADREQFFIEGWGSYRAFDASTGQLLVSGSMQVIDDGPRALDTFQSGVLDVRVEQSVVRHFALDRPNYVSVSELGLRMHVQKIDDDLYVTDYGVGHEVGLPGPEGQLELVACIEFSDRGDARKLIDLRGIGLVRDDYAERLERAGIRQAPPLPPPRWSELGACRGADQPAERCLCGPRRLPAASAGR